MKMSSQRGQGLVELSLSLMFILVLLAGVLDMGRAMFAYIALRDAAVEGALYGSFQPSDSSGIEDRARGSSDSPLDMSDSSVVSVSVSYLSTTCAGNNIVVSVSHDFEVAAPFMETIVGGPTFTLTASAERVIMQPTCP